MYCTIKVSSFNANRDGTNIQRHSVIDICVRMLSSAGSVISSPITYCLLNECMNILFLCLDSSLFIPVEGQFSVVRMLVCSQQNIVDRNV